MAQQQYTRLDTLPAALSAYEKLTYKHWSETAQLRSENRELREELEQLRAEVQRLRQFEPLKPCDLSTLPQELKDKVVEEALRMPPKQHLNCHILWEYISGNPLRKYEIANLPQDMRPECLKALIQANVVQLPTIQETQKSAAESEFVGLFGDYLEKMNANFDLASAARSVYLRLVSEWLRNSMPHPERFDPARQVTALQRCINLEYLEIAISFCAEQKVLKHTPKLELLPGFDLMTVMKPLKRLKFVRVKRIVHLIDVTGYEEPNYHKAITEWNEKWCGLLQDKLAAANMRVKVELEPNWKLQP